MVRVVVVVLLLLAIAAAQREDGLLSDCRDAVEDKDKQILELQSQLKTKESALVEMQGKTERLVQLEAEIETLKQQLARTQSATEGQLSKCQQGLEAKKREVSKFQEQLQESESKEKALSSDLQKTKDQLTNFETAQNEGEGQLHACKTELKEVANKMLKAEQEADEARVQYLVLQRDLRPASVYHCLMRQLNDTIDAMVPYMLQYGDIVKEYPVVGKFASTAVDYLIIMKTWTMKGVSIATKKISEGYVVAKPVIKQVTDQSIKYMLFAQKQVAASYAVAKPRIQHAASIVQKYVSIGASHVGVWAKEGSAIASAKLNEVLESEAVANLKHQSAISTEELRQFVASHMEASPVLSPYANPKTVDFVLYTLLSLPGVVLISLLQRCCAGSNTKKKAGKGAVDEGPQEGASHETKDAASQENPKGAGGKKAKKSKGRARIITEGGDSVRVP